MMHKHGETRRKRRPSKKSEGYAEHRHRGVECIQCGFGQRIPERFVRKEALLESLGRPNAKFAVCYQNLKAFATVF
ncbi:uncharacterized protein BCR38DRAFT_444084 [Pseudomassariella vexata]|uniref:Uncharacterized protein n=1 Tax=Pseudomassariella vexata TaxID=1141098 RepID=A0A1Y2DLJ1_9PEZI|nr:uncharacterized protein BCR38DRAFT_444084 [Pseudomassariella vexata]ORY60133.1 hypothetical protein BCR38DRAFT_444084 [Pseudomassariella vexata]